MRRREFLIGGAAAVWPVVARGQQAATPLIGFLRNAPLAASTHVVDAFRQGLKEAGYVEGQHVAVEYRSVEADAVRLPALVADVLRRRPAVVVGDTTSVLAMTSA